MKKTDPSAADLFHEQFRSESDRACAILAAAALDESLRRLLQKYLVPAPGRTDALLDGANAPLSSFSAKIDAAFRLGLVSEQFARDLHLIRKIRNDFAHDLEKSTFSDAAVADRVKELVKESPLLAGMREEDRPKTTRMQYAMWASWMLSVLSERLESARALGQPPIEFGYDKSLTLERLEEASQQLFEGKRTLFPGLSDQEFEELRRLEIAHRKRRADRGRPVA
jgi:DNA-binding MltR family transcriptional regulator